MKFYDREQELAQFNAIRQASERQARMTVLVGRRRIGKTELVLRCGGHKPLLYFFVARKAEPMLCQDFIAEAQEKLRQPIGQYSSFSKLFRHLLILSQQMSFTLVIDEFQDWMRINPAVFSEMQREWDLGKAQSHMNLIISGSIFSLMHRIFEDSKEPLFSRASRIITLQPFGTAVLKRILHDHNPSCTPQDLLTLYTITHGVAWYVSLLIDDNRVTAPQMLAMLTEPNSPFINEGRNLLIEEFGPDYGNYFSILSCIAGGEVTRAQIEASTGIKEVGGYLSRLITHYNLIERHTPIFSKPLTKNVRYVMHDNFLTLWFRFFYKYQSFVESWALGQLARIIARDISSVEGFMLERYFRQKLRESGQYTQIGRYWNRKGGDEIDIVAFNEIDQVLDVFEVKKDRRKYSEALLRQKVEHMLTATPALAKAQVRLGVLSEQDM